MKILLYLTTVIVLWLSSNAGSIDKVPTITYDSTVAWDESQITGYHFHVYFFQNNTDSKQEAIDFRQKIHKEIEKGVLKGCRLNSGFYPWPRGPHPVGNYETCCNATSLGRGMSWFMKNRGNLSVLFHPLTKYEFVDHSVRAMFMGPSFKVDLHVFTEDLPEPRKCVPMPYIEAKN